MPLLREVPPPGSRAAAHRSQAQRAHDKRATEAFHCRLDQFEQQANELRHALVLIEKAVRWLPGPERARARRRLRELGLHEQLDPFAGLRDMLDAA